MKVDSYAVFELCGCMVKWVSNSPECAADIAKAARMAKNGRTFEPLTEYERKTVPIRCAKHSKPVVPAPTLFDEREDHTP